MRPAVALLASAAGAALVALDGTVLIVVQPALRRDLGASAAQVQWTSTAYLLTVAAFLVIAGRLGDRYGHPRLLLTGSLGFAAASAGIALAPGAGWVIALRAVQGLFGALLQPATLALLRVAYPRERLGPAVAVRTAAIAVAAAAGPLIGGVLVARADWRAVFVLNVPVALAIAVLTSALRVPPPARAGAGAERLGAAAPALLAAALGACVYALSGVPEHGWTGAPTLLGCAAAVGLGVLFVRGERRGERPLVPAAVARSRPVAASMVLLMAVSAGMFGALFTATFLLQDVRGLGPLETGVRVLPLTALMVAGAPVAGRAVRRYGARATALAGTGLVVAGIAGLGSGGPVAFGVLGTGFTAVMVTATGTVVEDAPPGYAGVVGGLKQTAANVGPSLGIAVAAGAGAAGAGTDAGAALPVLAGVAAVGLAAAALLPGRTPVGEVSGPAGVTG
ncbi:Antiseptic resistance protein [Streptomyces lavendulae subsp. lavendulae]|uniref:Antiseptic resistance protein n=1 Tax=Streptomyces lavendulae subsp. lavendulae TaxID=58340 RepID=A0A2K8PP85_STRLA|nr:MFS transporter [Streptomyces lavendulae]ATZ28534.1 Antiseptic resistance protein [Streptomyces lavendulae subsp. lavendulae]QUQ58359.1 Antiseptic resistance protein [Streptomyces lavendulae subsp. lavendulae]